MTGSFRKICRAFPDWRHGRGFGVHSPWAFRVIDEVLHEKSAYYNYPRVDALAGAGRERAARAVFRLLIHFRPSSVTVFGGDEWHGINTLAGAADANGQRLAIVDNLNTAPEDVLEAVGEHGAIIVLRDRANASETFLSALRTVLPQDHGMTVDSIRTLAVINLRADLPYQLIRARF